MHGNVNCFTNHHFSMLYLRVLNKLTIHEIMTLSKKDAGAKLAFMQKKSNDVVYFQIFSLTKCKQCIYNLNRSFRIY